MYEVSTSLLSLLLDSEKMPLKKWDKHVKKTTKKWKKIGMAESVLTGRDVIQLALKKICLFDHDYRSHRLIDIKNGGWKDGLKYAQKLIGGEVFVLWTAGGRIVVSSQIVTGISMNIDDIKFSVMSKGAKHRNLLLSDLGKTWFIYKEEALERIRCIENSSCVNRSFEEAFQHNPSNGDRA